MRKLTSVLFFILIIIIIFVLSSCYTNPSKLTEEQAKEIALPYFQNKHNLNVTVNEIEYNQVGDSLYLNCIKVTEGKTVYELVLDKSNKPLADNVSQMGTINSIDLSLLAEITKPSELGLKVFDDINVVFSYTDKRYIVQIFTETKDMLNMNSKKGIYTLLSVLNDIGVDKFIIVVKTPDFLIHGNGLQLNAEFFDTGIDEESFEKQYYKFSNEVYWDKQKFEEKITELTDIGYKNVSFFMPNSLLNGNTIEIVLYCESELGLDKSKAIAVLNEIDDSYFKIEGDNIVYTVEHVYK